MIKRKELVGEVKIRKSRGGGRQRGKGEDTRRRKKAGMDEAIRKSEGIYLMKEKFVSFKKKALVDDSQRK